MGIAVGDPINRVNLLYFMGVDRIHRIDRTHDVGSIDPDPVWRSAIATEGTNMKRLVIILTFWIWLPAAAAAGEPRTHIDETVVKFVAAYNAGDAATVASLYTEDAALFPPGGERVDGRAAIQAFWQGAIDSGMKIDDLHAVEVEARGNMAGEIGVFTLSVPAENGPTKVGGKYIIIWMRSGQTWQLHRDIWNTN